MTLDLAKLRSIAEAAREGEGSVDTLKSVFSRFDATFDPPTVLALLDRLEAAEAYLIADGDIAIANGWIATGDPDRGLYKDAVKRKAAALSAWRAKVAR